MDGRVRYGMVWYGMIRCGLYGVIWYMVRYGLVWNGR
jgi:hypothetical protein